MRLKLYGSFMLSKIESRHISVRLRGFLAFDRDLFRPLWQLSHQLEC